MLARDGIFGTMKNEDSFAEHLLYAKTGAHGFNIEGGTSIQALKEGALYVYLAMVLDNSIVSGETLHDVEQKLLEGGFPIKEAAIEDYDELKVNLATFLILSHYINNGHHLTHKSSEETLHLVVHTHRTTSGIYTNHLIANMLQTCLPGSYQAQYVEVENKKKEKVQEITELKLLDKNVVIHFKRGYQVTPEPIYKEADILFSYSLVGGLSHLKPGSMLLPQKFIPYKETELKLFKDQTYTISNHLVGEIKNIVAAPQDDLIETFEKNFKSTNPAKKATVSALTERDFYPSTLLEIGGMYHPRPPVAGVPPRIVEVTQSVMENHNPVSKEILNTELAKTTIHSMLK